MLCALSSGRGGAGKFCSESFDGWRKRGEDSKKLVFHKTSDKRLSSSFILVSSSKGLFLGLHKRREREKFGVRSMLSVEGETKEQKINKQSKY